MTDIFAVVVGDDKIVALETSRAAANKTARKAREDYDFVGVKKVSQEYGDPKFLFSKEEVWRRVGPEFLDDFATADRTYKALVS